MKSVQTSILDLEHVLWYRITYNLIGACDCRDGFPIFVYSDGTNNLVENIGANSYDYARTTGEW